VVNSINIKKGDGRGGARAAVYNADLELGSPLVVSISVLVQPLLRLDPSNDGYKSVD
jgi:hypothetical protein